MHEHTPDQRSSPSATRRAALTGAALGALALAGTVVGVGALAGAQDTPPTDGAEWAAFDECLADHLGELWIEPEIVEFDDGDLAALESVVIGTSVVHIESPDGFQVIEFGDSPATVTITGDADGLDVTTDGDVIVVDEEALEAEWETFDEAHEACEDQLPGDVFFEHGFVEGPWFDSADLGYDED